MLILSKKLAGAAATPKGEPSGSRSLRLRADQSRDSGVGALSRLPANVVSCAGRLVSSPGGVSRQPTSVCELCWSLRFFTKAPMLIFREALDIFAHRCFYIFPLQNCNHLHGRRQEGAGGLKPSYHILPDFTGFWRVVLEVGYRFGSIQNPPRVHQGPEGDFF